MTTQANQSDIMDEEDVTTLDENPGSGENPGQDEDSDITPGELELLDDAGTEDNDDLTDDQLLDGTDDEGDKLNEENDLAGEDLDVPGSETDDMDESAGEEDEENNVYSSSDQEDDDEDDSDTDL